MEWDKSGDEPLVAGLERYLREKEPPPPGGVFAGVIHRLDRPTSGCVVYAKTPTAQRQMNALFRAAAAPLHRPSTPAPLHRPSAAEAPLAHRNSAPTAPAETPASATGGPAVAPQAAAPASASAAAPRSVTKTYWAVVDSEPPAETGVLEHFIYHDRELNKSLALGEERKKAKRAQLAYRLIGRSDRYFFLEIDLITGRHHQIRAQLAAVGCHIKGDLKYGARRSNPEGGIHLHARAMSFRHPVREHPVTMVAAPPDETLWNLVVETAQ